MVNAAPLSTFKPLARDQLTQHLSKFGDDRTTAKFVRDTRAKIADREVAASFGRVRCDVHKTHSAKISVAVFNTSEHAVGESIFNPGAGSPAGRMATVGDERSSSGKGVRR